MKQHINKNFISENLSQAPIHHTKLYTYTYNEHVWREDRSLTSVIQLSIWVLYYRDPITFHTSIIESFEGNRSQLIFSVTEKSKKIFP